MPCGRREPPRLVKLHSFGLVASLVNTLPKWLPYATHLLQSQLALVTTKFYPYRVGRGGAQI